MTVVGYFTVQVLTILTLTIAGPLVGGGSHMARAYSVAIYGEPTTHFVGWMSGPLLILNLGWLIYGFWVLPHWWQPLLGYLAAAILVAVFGNLLKIVKYPPFFLYGLLLTIIATACALLGIF